MTSPVISRPFSLFSVLSIQPWSVIRHLSVLLYHQRLIMSKSFHGTVTFEFFLGDLLLRQAICRQAHDRMQQLPHLGAPQVRQADPPTDPGNLVLREVQDAQRQGRARRQEAYRQEEPQREEGWRDGRCQEGVACRRCWRWRGRRRWRRRRRREDLRQPETEADEPPEEASGGRREYKESPRLQRFRAFEQRVTPCLSTCCAVKNSGVTPFPCSLDLPVTPLRTVLACYRITVLLCGCDDLVVLLSV